MEFPRDGIEYVTWPVTGAPNGSSLEAQLNEDGTWHPMEWVTDPTEARLLVAGPDADLTNSPDAVQLAEKQRQFVEIRLVSGPEIVIREGGYFDLIE